MAVLITRCRVTKNKFFFQMLLFANQIICKQKCSWTEVPLYIYLQSVVWKNVKGLSMLENRRIQLKEERLGAHCRVLWVFVSGNQRSALGSWRALLEALNDALRTQWRPELLRSTNAALSPKGKFSISTHWIHLVSLSIASRVQACWLVPPTPRVALLFSKSIIQLCPELC